MSETTQAVSIDVQLLEDQTDCVFRELELAIHWERPSILFAIYNSKSIRRQAEDALENRILESGKTVIHYHNDDEGSSTLVQFVSKINCNQDTIFFIDPVGSDSLNHATDFLYKNLNSSRDQLIERLIRVVFWLTENEAFNLARNAPDFWASRHRVIDFVCQNPAESPCPIESLKQVTQPALTGQPANGISVLLRLGVTNWKNGDHTRAVEFLLAALKIAEQNSDAANQAICWKAIALVKADAGLIDDAIQAYSELIHLASENITVWNNIGALYQKTGRFEKAFNAFNNALKKTPQNPVSWNGLGNVYASTGQNLGAIKCYKKAIQFNANYINPWVNLGDAYASLNQNDLALKAYTRAAALDGKNAHVWCGIGDANLKINACQPAIDAYFKALELGADPDRLSANLAAAYTHLGEYARAIPHYQKAIEFSTTRKEKTALWSKLGDAYRRTGEYDNAMAAYKMSDKLSIVGEIVPPNQSRIANPPAAAASAEPAPARIEPIIKARIDAPESDSESARLWLQLGSMYIKIGAVDKALGAYQKAANLDGRDGQIYSQIAHLYEKKNDTAQALIFHQKNLELLSNDTERAAIHNRMAELHRQRQDFASALQSLETALNLDPDNETILSGLEKIQQDLDENIPPNSSRSRAKKPASPALPVTHQQLVSLAAGSAQGRAALETSINEGKLDNANVWNELGNIFAKSGSYEDAVDAYNRAIELDPEFGWSHSNLARVLAAQGKYEQSLDLYHQSLELLFSDTDKAITWNRLGGVYRQINRYGEAMQAYQNADKLSQQNNSAGGEMHENNFDQPFTHFIV